MRNFPSIIHFQQLLLICKVTSTFPQPHKKNINSRSYIPQLMNSKNLVDQKVYMGSCHCKRKKGRKTEVGSCSHRRRRPSCWCCRRPGRRCWTGALPSASRAWTDRGWPSPCATAGPGGRLHLTENTSTSLTETAEEVICPRAWKKSIGWPHK